MRTRMITAALAAGMLLTGLAACGDEEPTTGGGTDGGGGGVELETDTEGGLDSGDYAP